MNQKDSASKNKVSGKAPAKIILNGEHAVVYGQPALVGTINLYSTCIADFNGEDEIHLDYPQLDYNKVYKSSEFYSIIKNLEDKFDKVKKGEKITPKKELGILILLTIALFLKKFELKLDRGLKLIGKSEIPTGGFGSSTAAVISVLKSLSSLFEKSLNEESLFDLTFEVESIIYRIESGINAGPSGIDQSSISHGGLLKFQKINNKPHFEKLNLQSPLIENILIIKSGTPENSTGEVVGKVKNDLVKEKDKIEAIFKTLGENTEKMINALKKNDTENFYNTIKSSSDNLISLGIVTLDSQHLIQEIEKLGGVAKVSGAGSLSGKGSGTILAFGNNITEIQHMVEQMGYETMISSII